MAKSIQVEHLLEDFEYQGHEYEVLVELDVVDDTIQLSELIEVHDNDTDELPGIAIRSVGAPI